MISLVTHLCNTFKCEPKELHEYIRGNRRVASQALEKAPLYFSPEEGLGLTPLHFGGLTLAGPRTLFAKGGQLGITLEQYCLVVHPDKPIDYPQLQCIIQKAGVYGGEIYVPIEFVLVDLKK